MKRRSPPVLIAAFACLGVLVLVIYSESQRNASIPEATEDSRTARLPDAGAEERLAATEAHRAPEEEPGGNPEQSSHGEAPGEQAVTVETQDDASRNEGGNGRDRAPRFPNLVRLGKSQSNLDEWQRLLDAQEGERVMLPLDPPAEAIVKTNHLHETGGHAFNAELVDYDESTMMSLVFDETGRPTGHLLQDGNGVGFLVSVADGDVVTVERTQAGNIVCVRNGDDGGNVLLGMDEEPADGTDDPVGADAQANIPIFNSRPSSSYVIYLDFDGEVVENTSWKGGDRIDAQPYRHPDRIDEIWENMAEDFLPWDVNVTTDRAVFDNAATSRRCMAIFTPTKDAAPSAGGVAYLNSFGSSVNYMCWVYNSGTKSAGETGSHEVGHQLGLRHDGGGGDGEYYRGHTHVTGVSWGAIMGAAFSPVVVHWSKGSYTGANRQEDDLREIDDYLNYRADDYGSTTATASNIPVDASQSFTRNGAITRNTDVDVFRITTNSSGTITAAASPTSRYPNLDISLEILNSSGSVIRSDDPQGPLNASVSATGLAPGTYYIRVDGVGLGATGFAEDGYDDYGSMGEYTLTGTYPFIPTPLPPVNLSASDGTSPDHIRVTWDPSANSDGYRVYRSTTPSVLGATLVGATATNSYNDTGVTPLNTYYYFVKAFNSEGDSDFSSSDSGYRDLPAPGAPSGVTASDGSSTAYVRVAWNRGDWAEEYVIYRNTSNTTSGATEIAVVSDITTFYDDTEPVAPDVHYYFVRTRNRNGISDFSAGDSGYKRIPPPDAPTGVSADDEVSSDYTRISWSASPYAAGYYVYRNVLNAGGGSYLGSTSGLFFDDWTGAAGIVYYYSVRAFNENGQSGYGARDGGARLAVEPDAPQNLTALKGVDRDFVRVAWDRSDETTHYRLYRGTQDDAEEASPLARGMHLITPFFNDFEVEDGRTYFYFVRAVNAVGPSPFSEGDYGYTSEESTTDDPFENNDLPAKAYDLRSFEDKWLSELNRYGSKGIAADADFYRFELRPDDDRIDVMLDADPSAGELDLSLLEIDGLSILESQEAIEDGGVSYVGEPGGSYLILVSPREETGGQYDLKIQSLSEGDPAGRSDLTLGKNGRTLRGEDRYHQRGGAGQRFRSVKKGNRTHWVYFTVENEAAVPQSSYVWGSRTSRTFSVTYYRANEGGGWRNATGEVRRRDAVPSVEMQHNRYWLKVRPRRIPRWQTRRRVVWIHSTVGTSNQRDTGRIDVLKVKDRRRRR